MTVIGLTGNIGSGKSTVSKLMAENYNCHIINADIVGIEVVEPKGLAYAQLHMAFGAEYFDEFGKLIRPKMAELVFNNKKSLELLNSITHPAIIEDIQNKVKKIYATEENANIVVEAAVLIEADMLSIMDEIWLVLADDEVRLSRAMVRDNAEREAVLARMNSQMPQSEKVKYATVVVHNNSDIDTLTANLEIAWQEYKNNC